MKIVPIRLSQLDIPILLSFGATDEQDHNLVTLPTKIDAISRSMVDPEFTNAVTNALAIAEVSQPNSIQTNSDFGAGLPITQPI